MNTNATPETIVELARRTRRGRPRQRAAGSQASAITYSELLEGAGRVAAGLQGWGCGDGARAAVLAPNGLEFLQLYFAAPLAGAILVPLNTRLTARELAEILADCGTGVLVASERFEELARATLELGTPVRHVLWIGDGAPIAGVDRARFDTWARDTALAPVAVRHTPDDPAQIYYTSGTSGRPKGVVLTHGNVLAHAAAAAEELELCARDVWGHFAPMFHLADAWACFAVTLVGGAHVFLPQFEAAGALETIAAERVTLSNLVPTMLNRMVHDPRAATADLSSLRMILSGGAPIAPQLVRRVMDVFGCEYVQTYGMTETSPYLTLSRLHEHLKALPLEEQFRYRAKTGRAFKAVELRVVDEDGVDVARDGRAVGEILARGPTVTPGYWQLPAETALALGADGWLRTGDLATIDPEGYLDIVDRKKDVILTGGETVYSTQVEHRLAEHPDVLECAVFGRPDPEWGELVCAAVVLHPSGRADAQALEDFCGLTLAGYKRPRRIEFLTELPRTGSGKIAKRLLRGGRG